MEERLTQGVALASLHLFRWCKQVNCAIISGQTRGLEVVGAEQVGGAGGSRAGRRHFGWKGARLGRR